MEEEKGGEGDDGGLNWGGDEDEEGAMINDDDFEFDTARVQLGFRNYMKFHEISQLK